LGPRFVLAGFSSCLLLGFLPSRGFDGLAIYNIYTAVLKTHLS